MAEKRIYYSPKELKVIIENKKEGERLVFDNIVFTEIKLNWTTGNIGEFTMKGFSEGRDIKQVKKLGEWLEE